MLVSVAHFYPSFLDGTWRRSTACRLGGIYYSSEFQHHILHDDFDTAALSVNDHFTLSAAGLPEHTLMIL
jgi:hypothetical protein